MVSLDGAKDRLHLFKADLLEEGSFDSAIVGCDGVFHTASPVIHSANDPQVKTVIQTLIYTLIYIYIYYDRYYSFWFFREI